MDIDSAWSEMFRIPRRNDQLTKDIINVTQQTGDITQPVKKLLKRLCDTVNNLNCVINSDFNSGLFRLVDGVFFDAWRSFFQPIEALRQLPACGDFVAARMLLLTGWAFMQAPGVEMDFKHNNLAEETTPLHEYLTDLDDALLVPLKNIWTLSESRERFDWVFTNFVVTDMDELTEALALSPQELEDVGGIKGVEYSYNDSDDPSKFTLYTGPIPRWDCGEQDWDEFPWQLEGTDGPITGFLEYKVRHNGGIVVQHKVQLLRRSRQFCRDSRQKSEAHIGRQQHQAFELMARCHRIPPEIRNRILNYVEYRDPFPYLEKLDLVEAYASFPGFHTFHKNNCETWSLCARHDCAGHHDDDEDWEVKRDPDFTKYLESQAARGNDEFVSLDRVGLGPMNPIRTDVASDGTREAALFGGQGIYSESTEDVKMIGGIGGLKDAMIHGRTLTAAWEGDDYGGNEVYSDGVEDTDPTWQYGRNLSSENTAKEVMKGLHSEPGHCEWCV
ncbi:uncharacterized protein BKA55DRAFT_686541 [Fusarium redolens]|uniref:Uncharacterized protein n=1 Tax=Fusarium redolens TaxID=48865 RepID=A0A9P9HPZ8_FUSRE|nr:uncharacterized protein BKA55DRAFT_686541 [Fusarium redolens]KAH7260963.1 hypothetical protein BKA55DRAFT_686541 [Fusarium redolens]